ncbi:MAG: hypothetical protein H7Y42_01620 [Chitinophagaceae bacterium]|nr:hypothetical protein [Chitinophagaceae bacterium]
MMTVAYRKQMKLSPVTSDCVLRTLAYFSIFQYPLTRQEIIDFMHPSAERDAVDEVLAGLVLSQKIFKIDEFYMLVDDSNLVQRRREGNKRADQLIPVAMRIGRFLSRFPYVRGIAISGSLSKRYADDEADVDFFIVTKANRLWIARTCMHLFKKLTFLTGRQHLYCMNYYIDENSLVLDDQNIYTAIETRTLLPVCGEGINEFVAANTWVDDWIAIDSVETRKLAKNSIPFYKNILEWLLNSNRLDSYLMKLTTRRWDRKKERQARNDQGKEMDLITGKHFARSNPGMFQERLLMMYAEKLQTLDIK